MSLLKVEHICKSFGKTEVLKDISFELEKSGCTVLCVDYKMAGVGSNSCGPALAQKYRIQLPEIHGQLNLSIE